MALGYAIKGRGTSGDMFVRIVDITFDAAYAAGGYTLDTRAIGIGSSGVVLAVIPCGEVDGYNAEWDESASKLKVRDSSGAVGVANPEAATNLAALNGVVGRFVIYGKGSPG